MDRWLHLLDGHAWLVFALACGGLFIAILFEQSQLLAKYQGARRQVVATGYNNAMKLVVANRVGAVLYFFFIALAIDGGIAPGELAGALALVVAAIGLANLALALFFARKLNPGTPAGALFLPHGRLGTGDWLALAGALVATAFNYAGLTVPLIWSASYPELRLTLANSGFLFNSIFTLFNVFLVEARIARLIDEGSDAIAPFVGGIFGARLLAAVAVVPVLLGLTG